jgi:hypothetical protein
MPGRAPYLTNGLFLEPPMGSPPMCEPRAGLEITFRTHRVVSSAHDIILDTRAGAWTNVSPVLYNGIVSGNEGAIMMSLG